MKKTRWGIWVKNIGWLVDDHTYDKETKTYTPVHAVWNTKRDAKQEADELNGSWKKRELAYSVKKYEDQNNDVK